MKRGIFQLFTAIALIGLIFFALSQINWITKLHIKEIPSIDEDKIERFLWERCKLGLDLEPQKSATQTTTEHLLKAICTSNEWNDTIYHIHINQSKEINAFAFPGNHLVLNTALINFCKTEGELMSVMSHEMAHINKNHPMELLKREIGVSLLSALLLGENNSKVIGQISKSLTISAYQREEETQADLLGAKYLINCKKDPQEFINFQQELSKKESSLPSSMDWIQSHPNWEQRIADLHKLIKELDYKPASTINILTIEEWNELKDAVKP